MGTYIINENYPIAITTGALIRAFNLQNVKVPDVRQITLKTYEKDDNGNVKYPQRQPDSKRRQLPTDFPKSPNPDYQLPVSQEPDTPIATSYLGTPVFADLTLKGGQYVDNITGEQVTFEDIRFEAVLISVDFSARIVKTEIQGRNGTIKEYIGEDDAKVGIQGVICGWNGHYPALEVSKLNEWRKAPIAKAAVSSYLQNLGIQSLVVEDCSIPQIAGGYSYQTFSMNCISDIPVELKITN